jgi:hypothetical protein
MSLKKGPSFKELYPYAIAFVVFALIIIIYFLPFFQGKRLSASDTVHFTGMSKELVDYREKTGEEALWTNNMFGGMPAYQISTLYPKNLMNYLDQVFHFGFHAPVGMVIMYFLGFFFLLLVLGVNPWLSISGAIAFAFSSYFFIILEAGHNSKAFAIGYMAPVLAGVILAYRGKYFAGGLVTAIFLALQVLSGHPQITYYLMFMVLFYGIAELVRHIRENRIPAFVKASAVLIIAALLGVMTHTASLWSTYEYSKYSIRGKTELSSEKENRTSGLDKDYATDWSYGVAETMTFLIPNFHGGSSHGSLSTSSETYKTLKDNRVPNAESIIKGLPLYWGPQPFTSGPVYVGAIVVFLFIFSLFYLKGPLKWWGIAVTLFSILLSWGKHFMPLTNFFLEYVPLYNKFRAVSMILVIAELSIPLLAFIALDRLIRDENKPGILKSLKITLFITGGLLLFFILFAGSLFSFSSPGDTSMGLPDWLLNSIREDRRSMFRNDAIRSLIFILLTFGLIWVYLKGKLQVKYLWMIIPVLILADMWPVNKRYLNDDDFKRKAQVTNPYQPTKADQAILKDTDPYYRVYNFQEAFDQSARTSYFHKNIGGYHGAKMRRYQEIIELRLTPERRQLVDALSGKSGSPDDALKNATTFNMLNTKYFILDDDQEPLMNLYACGNAWFVEDYFVVNNADEEIAALEGLDPDKSAVIDKRFEPMLGGFTKSSTSQGTISLLSYAPNHLVYESKNERDGMAIFSEIYYDKGWKAFIDGKETQHFRANFILRGMIIPAGEHRIEFKFEPTSYYAGQNISLVSSILLILLLAGYFAKQLMDFRRAG